jgi:hypothetical protein
MARLGDVFEIPTKKGFVYVQVTHKRPPYGTLIRVMRGVFKEEPSDLQELANRDHAFVIFAPMDALCKRGQARLVGRAAVPVEASQFPLFKVPFYLDAESIKKRWWLWDGLREWPVAELTADQRSLPTRTVVTGSELIYRLETDWSPECDV